MGTRIKPSILAHDFCFQAPDSSLYISTGNLVFARINLKPAVLKNFVVDWALCFRPCEVYRFQTLAGLEAPIEHTLKDEQFTKRNFHI